MKVLDLFSGTGSSTQAFEDAGCEVYRVELDPQHTAELHANILDLTADEVLTRWGRPDFIWASPPCTSFSVASIGHHWGGGFRAYQPKTDAARLGLAIVAHTLALIQELAPPKGWIMENPRGVLRKLPVMRGIDRRTITYCSYGDERMKPTDLWGGFPEGWMPRPICRNGDKCHVAAPRGSRTGTQGRDGAVDRSRVPYQLSQDLCRAVMGQPAIQVSGQQHALTL